MTLSGRLLRGVAVIAVIAGGAYYAKEKGYLDKPIEMARAQLGAPAPQAATPAAPPVGGRPPARPVPVIVVPVAAQDVPIDVSAVGSVAANLQQFVRSRVDGEIVKIHFEEGAEVRAGDVIISLDNRQISAQLKQAEANMARNRTSLANAKREVARYSELVGRDFVSKQKFDELNNQVAVLEAQSRADESAVEGLRVQLSYTTIRAAITGRAGAVNLTQGNAVKGNDSGTIVTINQVQPIDVKFGLPQRHFAALRESMARGEAIVTAGPPGAKDRARGAVDFIDNAIDPASGTFQVKASFANEDLTLWPGMFVETTLRLGIQKQTAAIPTRALQTGQQGTFVYVIKPDDTAEVRLVTVSRDTGVVAAIEKGLEIGERVVIDGQLRLVNGTKVEARPAPTPPAETAQAPRS
jgi:multidrug efflux system membrane fusion protein